MKFSEMIKMLQEKEKRYIVLINSGSFYVARGKDAILLNKILELKLTCMEKEICKVGFPIGALEKYTKILKRKRYSYIVYNFDRNKNNLKIIEKYKGNTNSLGRENKKDCIMCKMGTSGYIQKEEKYKDRKITSEIEFKFIINGSKKSITYWNLELPNKSIVKTQAYDDIADFCYKELHKEDIILIYGRIIESEKIEIKQITKI